MSRTNSVSFYWYSDVNDVMFRAIQDVKENPTKGGDIIAHILYLENGTNKIAIVYMYRSDIHNISSLSLDERKRIKKVLTINYNESQVVGKSTITKQEIFDGEILEVGPLNRFYQSLPSDVRKFSKFKHLASYQDCETKECIADYNKCDEKKFIFEDNKTNFETQKQLPHTFLFCREKSVNDMTAELDAINDLFKFKDKIFSYFRMPNFFEKIQEAVNKGTQSTKRMFYLLKDIPEFRVENVIDEQVYTNLEEEIETYFTDENGDSKHIKFFDLIKKHRYTIAGGFVLKNVLKSRPGYNSKYWEDNDIDIWGMRDNENSELYDPFDPLKKLLQETGYTLKKICGRQLLLDFEGDYKRLINYVENIQEWTKIINGETYKIQLILLKNKDAHFKYIMRQAEKELEYGNINSIDQYYLPKSLKYQFRNYEDFIYDLILSFDLTCCQCSFTVDDSNNKKIVFFRNNMDEFTFEGRSILESIYNYNTAFGSQCLDTQTLWEWLRTEIRAIKYSLRGFKIINWSQVLNTFEKLFTEQYIDENFMNGWNNNIGIDILNKAVATFPIFVIEDDIDEIGTFTMANTQYQMLVYGESVQNRIKQPLKIPDRYPLLRDLQDLSTNELTLETICDTLDINYNDPDLDISVISYPTTKEDNVFDSDEYKLNYQVDQNELLQEDATCFDSLLSEDKNNLTFLNEDEDNILFVRKVGNSFQSECLNRKIFYKILSDPLKGRYPCLARNRQTNNPNTEAGFIMRGWYDPDDCYYKVDTGFGSYFYTEEDLRNIIKSKVKIFFVEQGVSYQKGIGKSVVDNEERMFANEDYDEEYLLGAHHCQEGSAFATANIKVIQNIEEEKEREEKDEEESDEDEDDNIPLSQLRRRIDFSEEKEESEEESDDNLPLSRRYSMRNINVGPRGLERHPQGLRRRQELRRRNN